MPLSAEEREKERIKEMLKGNLFPCLRARSSFARRNADFLKDHPLGRSDKSKGFEGKMIYLPFAEQLAVGLLYDEGETYKYVRDVELFNWKLSIKGAMDIATVNLERISPPDFRQIQPGISLYVAAWPDEHTAARLILPEIFTRLPIVGEVIVMAPSADRILVADSSDTNAIMLLFEISASLWQEPRPIPMQPMILRNGAWADFELPVEHPCYFEWRLFALAALNLAYEQDAERIAVETKDTIFAGTLEVVQDIANGGIYTKSIVPEGRRSSLPCADYLEFFRQSANGQYESLAVCSLAKAREILEGRMEDDAEAYPPRVTIKSFPDSSQILRLGFEKESTLPAWEPPPALPESPLAEEEADEIEPEQELEKIEEPNKGSNL